MVVGGVRSGKSRFALDLAHHIGGDDVLFVATAESFDDEMDQRIVRHCQERPATWRTLECPRRVGQAIADFDPKPTVVLLDCLTLLISNVMCDEDADSDDWAVCVDEEVEALIAAVRNHDMRLIIVSGEVGCGVVPEHAMGRAFRDLLGLANQRLAAEADATYWMVAGLAINASQLAITPERAAL